MLGSVSIYSRRRIHMYFYDKIPELFHESVLAQEAFTVT